MRTLWSRPLLFSLSLAGLTLGTDPAQAALVAYWNFDQGSGMTLTDVSGHVNNHNGTLQGGAETPAWVTGRFGSALDFSWNSANNPGGGDRVVVPYHHELLLNGAFTISFWYRLDAATPSGTFPGIMRIGSQGATTGNNIGWGFYRTGNIVHKRGNAQPNPYPALNVGQWYHIALRYDGTTAANNNQAYLNGVAIPFSQNWLTATATNVVFELGRMDAFDDATLDDLALWHQEALAPARIRSLYTVPVSLNLDYNLGDMRQLWAAFDAPGTTNMVKGAAWSHTASLPGSSTAGDAYISGGRMYVVLGSGSGVSAPLTLLTGNLSPAGVGNAGTFTLSAEAGSAIVVSNANLSFDLRADTTVGGGTNDLIDITGDLTIANSRLFVNPLMPLSAGTYRLFNYTGNKTGSLTLSNTTRYALALDESTPGEINLVVSGANGAVKWNSPTSGAWDLTSANWLNLDTSAADRFFQGDAVTFDESGAFQANVAVNTPVFPRSLTVNAPTRNYTFAGPEPIGGLSDGLTKEGASTLTLSGPNTFIGDVRVNGGTVRLGNASALGATNGETIIASGATLDLAGISPGTEGVTVQGSGTNSNGAIVNTGAALSNNGLRGRVTMLGDTVFGGVNRWDMFGGRLIGNGYKLTKIGAPEIALSNLGDTGLGEIEVVAGILTPLGNTRLGDPTKALTVSNNAILAFWGTGTTILDKPFVLLPGAILRNNTSGNTDVTTNVGAVSITGDANVQASANIALLGEVSGSGNIVKVNNGALYLGGANTYSGRTVINAGRVALLNTGSINGSSRIEVASGAFFDVSRVSGAYPLAAGQVLAGRGSVAGSIEVPAGTTLAPGIENIAGTLTVTNGLTLSGGAIQFDATPVTTEGGNVNDLVVVGGNLNLTGTSVIRVNPLGILTAGSTYTVLSYTGTLVGDASNLSVQSESRYSFSVSVATAGKVTITVESGNAGDIEWIGGVPGAETLWDVMATENWSDRVSGLPSPFFAGDRVMFTDFGFETNVTLVGSLTPASITFENLDLLYTLQGTGKLSGASSITKRFGGTVVIANSNVNDNVGVTDIQEGTLRVGTGGTFGNLGSGIITNNGTLVFDRSDSFTLANSLQGAGALVKENANTVTLPTANPNYSGTIRATAGLIRPTVTNALGNGTGATVIDAGATLDVNGINHADERVIAAGAGAGGAGAVVNNGSGQNNALRFITMAGDTTVGGAARWDLRAAPTAELSTGGNGYKLTKVGSGQVSLVDVTVDPALGDIDVQAGILSVEIGSGSGDPTKTVTVASNATLQLWGQTVPFNKVSVLKGGRNLLMLSGSSTMNGPTTLDSSEVTVEVAGTALTMTDAIGGPGMLIKTGAGVLAVGGNNTYAGGTRINTGTLQLGIGGNSGSVLGDILNNGSVSVFRNEPSTFNNNVTGSGNFQVRNTAGLTLSSPVITQGGVSVGISSHGLLIVEPGVQITANNYFLGDSSAVSGDAVQLGGNITVNSQVRVGHWPSPVMSTYVLGGGSLTLTATPGGVVNQAGVAEQNGILYLGIDGSGTFVQTGGVASAHGIVLDARGNTTAGGTGVDTFILNGGRFNVGPSGIKSGSLDANTSIAVQLGGGTVAATANWTSVLPMTFTGTNGNTVFETPSSNALTGPLSGDGGLTKAGAGTLALTGNALFAGGTIVDAGTLLVRGTLGAGTASIVVNGTLVGDGVLADALAVSSSGTLSPGPGIARLAVNNNVTLAGNTVLDLTKSGSAVTNDLVDASGTVTYGGTLTVVASGAALAAGDAIKLFNGASYAGAFTALNLPALTGDLTWDVAGLAVDGTIRVSQPAAQLSIGFSGGNLSLSWTNGNNYVLQAQTNAPGVGIQSTGWVTIEGITTNSVSFPVEQNSGSVFYRLIKQ